MRTKNFYKQALLVLIALLSSIAACAYDVSALNDDGVRIYYNIKNSDAHTLEVTHAGAISYAMYFSGDYVIPSTVDINGVTYTVTGIGEKAFYNGTKVTSVTLPNTITSIGSQAFGNCAIHTLTIPESVVYIANSAVSGGHFSEPNSNIKTLYYNARHAEGNVMAYLIQNSFLYCGSFNLARDCEVIIGNEVEHIPNHFVSSSKIESIHIPSNVTSIGEFAFRQCVNLTSITLPSGIYSIGTGAFEGITGITTVIAGMVTPPEVEFRTFPFCRQAILYVPAGSLSSYASADVWKEFKEIKEPNRLLFADPQVEAICVANWDADGDGYIDQLEAYMVNDIGLSFQGLQITSFNELQHFTGIREIPDNAFAGCSCLSAITLPEQITAIGNNAFQGCTSLSSIVFPTSVKTIGNSAFEGCSALASVNDFSKLTSIGESAFEGCTSLPSIEITNNTTVAKSAFKGCTGLTSVNYNAASIKNNTFEGCTSLSSVTLGNKVSGIQEGAFKDCTSLAAISIPGSVVSVGGFEGCTSLSTVTLRAGTKYIINNSFKDCSSLNAISLPNGLLLIGESAFEGTALTTINIPSSVTSIQSRAFADCNNLATVNVNWATPIFVPAEAFPNRADQVLCVPGGTKGIYEVAEVWKDFKFIRDPSSKEPYALLSDDGKTLTFYYDADMGMQTGTTYSLNVGDNNPGWYTDNSYSNVTAVVFDSSFEAARPTSTANWFNGMSLLESISGIENLNTSEVTTMAQMFAGCSSLEDIELSHFNTGKLVNMDRMFWKCGSLTSLDLSNLNTSKVENMSWLFGYCNGLESIDMTGMNTSSVTNMMCMFFNCVSLTELDLTSFNTEQVTNMGTMFTSCTSLQTIYVGDGWSTENLFNSTNMFYNCTSLVGSMGTTFDANHVDAAYAHIDGGPSNPGYFSEKPQFVRGDVNGNNEVTIADVSALIDYLLTGDTTGIDLAAADCNGTDGVTIADVSALIDYLLTGNW